MGLDEDFVSAKERLNALKEDPGNEVKLQIYALFKQATVGKCNTPKPGMMDFVGKYKWEAWNTLGDMSQDEAKSKYIEVVQGLAAAEGATSPQVADTESAGTGKYKELTVHRDGKMFVITLNRPKKKNAINYQMYEEWGLALAEAAESDATIAVVTGAGDYYCSGNDLSNFMNIPPDGIAAMAEEGGRILKKFVSAFIDFPKPLLAAVNGPAVGVSVTVLGLFDIVYTTDTATFHTPFSALGQSPEGCSSLTFPQIMGTAKANEMLLFNRKLTAAEAMERGLVTEVFPDHSFQTEVWTRLREMAKLPPVSLRTSKGLIRDVDRAALHATNQRECDLLVDRWQSDECMNAIMNFFQQKAKL
ncbi:enoyl-CoA delta isomerase 2, mitochondrial isoform X2 [Lingula anatina]|nr:enoyl-CoA delta isomerase 2, mitochondrial isoform X2 [Lingula anatina]|eukprot:XP_013404825.1 enoyl-CoA delta isomerase 2, mitochondrial isoform X2 [Lingula anatina]